MQLIRSLLLPLLFLSTSSFAQVSTSLALEKELVGSWLAAVEGSDRARTLKIVGVKQKSEAVLSLDADFGFTGGEETVSFAEISEENKQRKLRVTAKSGAKINATQMPDGSFVGSFLFTNGQSKEISIKRLSEGTGGLLAIPNIERPSADVPASCAAFSGKWTGTWGYGLGQRWLWVVSVDKGCVAKFAWVHDSGRPKTFESVEIKDGALTWLCNKSTGGMCTLTSHGDELWVNYTDLQTGANNAVFKRVQ